MARQRRSECTRQRMRGGNRLGALVAAVGAAACFACAAHPIGPVGLGDDGTDIVGGTQSSPLVGTWQVILLVTTDGDVQRWTTRWTFEASGKCHFQRTVVSLAEGIPRTVDRDCTYVDQSTAVKVTYLDTQTEADVPYEVPLNSTTTLLIEGVEYERAT